MDKLKQISGMIEAMVKNQDHKIYIASFIYRKVLNLTPKQIFLLNNQTPPKTNIMALEGSKLIAQKNEQGKRYRILLSACERLAVRESQKEHLKKSKISNNRLNNAINF